MLDRKLPKKHAALKINNSGERTYYIFILVLIMDNGNKKSHRAVKSMSTKIYTK